MNRHSHPSDINATISKSRLVSLRRPYTHCRFGSGGAPYHLIWDPVPLRGAIGLAGMEKTQASRCWRGAQPKYRDMFEDPDVKRWYDNLSRGSRMTADVYLRRLGSICRSRGIRNPKELSALATDNGGRMWAYNFIMDMVTKLEAEGKGGELHSLQHEGPEILVRS